MKVLNEVLFQSCFLPLIVTVIRHLLAHSIYEFDQMNLMSDESLASSDLRIQSNTFEFFLGRKTFDEFSI